MTRDRGRIWRTGPARRRTVVVTGGLAAAACLVALAPRPWEGAPPGPEPAQVEYSGYTYEASDPEARRRVAAGEDLATIPSVVVHSPGTEPPPTPSITADVTPDPDGPGTPSPR